MSDFVAPALFRQRRRVEGSCRRKAIHSQHSIAVFSRRDLMAGATGLRTRDLLRDSTSTKSSARPDRRPIRASPSRHYALIL